MDETRDFDLRLFLPFLLNQASEESSLSFQRYYKERYGMLRTEWRVLFHLGIYGQLTARDIGLKARIHKTKISRAVQKLAERRFLERTRNEADRRQEFLTLTAKGQSVYEELKSIARAYDASLLAAFSDEETDLLRRLLLRLAKVDLEVD